MVRELNQIYSNFFYSDEYISDAAQTGLIAAKSKIIYFNHNNVRDLEEKVIKHATIVVSRFNIKKFYLTNKNVIGQQQKYY